MMETASVTAVRSPRITKMSACRNLSDLLGEPDHEQNKADLAHWNDHFDSMFAKKWGINPKTGEICADSDLKWERVDESSPSVPSAYLMSPLRWAGSSKAKASTDCPASSSSHLAHLGLYGPRSRVQPSSSQPDQGISDADHQITDNINNTPESSPVHQNTGDMDSWTLDTHREKPRASTPEPTDLDQHTERPRSSTPEPTGQDKLAETTTSASSTTSLSSTTSEIPASSELQLSRKRKQTSISEFFQQKKKCCTNRKILQ